MRLFTLFCFFVGLFSLELGAQSFVLSFDDAPMKDSYLKGEDRTEKLLEVLAKHEVEEAVFYSLSREEEISDRLMSYSLAGHIIANHTATHPSLEDISAEEYIAEIELAHQRLSRYPTYQKWFRYPYLREAENDPEKHVAIKDYLKNSGYRQGYVTVEVYDWHINSRFQQQVANYSAEDIERFRNFYVQMLWDSLEFYEKLAKEALGYSPVHVILLHENDINALFLGDFIQLAKSKGFKVAPAHEAFLDPVADTQWDYCPYSMRRLRTVAEASGFSRKRGTPSLVSTGHLDEMMKTAQLLK
jgi:peptidoglycan/xylan/chitin deacetylase (PgdA/CDA1 family)